MNDLFSAEEDEGGRGAGGKSRMNYLSQIRVSVIVALSSNLFTILYIILCSPHCLKCYFSVFFAKNTMSHPLRVNSKENSSMKPFPAFIGRVSCCIPSVLHQHRIHLSECFIVYCSTYFCLSPGPTYELSKDKLFYSSLHLQSLTLHPD